MAMDPTVEELQKVSKILGEKEGCEHVDDLLGGALLQQWQESTRHIVHGGHVDSKC